MGGCRLDLATSRCCHEPVGEPLLRFKRSAVVSFGHLAEWSIDSQARMRTPSSLHADRDVEEFGSVQNIKNDVCPVLACAVPEIEVEREPAILAEEELAEGSAPFEDDGFRKHTLTSRVLQDVFLRDIDHREFPITP